MDLLPLFRQETPASDRDLPFSEAEGTRCLSQLPRSHFCAHAKLQPHSQTSTAAKEGKVLPQGAAAPQLVSETCLLGYQTAASFDPVAHSVAD